MVSKTFLNLDSKKQARIIAALNQEFSSYSLAEAQVARIVKDAAISRGAFYKYFDDLDDAYLHLYKLAMTDIHRNLVGRLNNFNFDPNLYIEEVENFVNQINQTDYYQFIKMHFLKNESLLAGKRKSPSRGSSSSTEENDRQWAAKVLSHETIKLIMLNPEVKDMAITRLAILLKQLSKKGDE
ncbi:putative Transcriptional regulator [Oenococcus oeni]|uniref:TetR/AcrR family transcriptional regulator n=1 Tax=Oenococcus oeni TaxID=1247 RepID=UPI00107A8FF1|nr:TetR/AcrR family transcriptional regulator [Oenococcus oeni]AVI93913.1 TetR family transcriptional regulator [Oenococcus oeni]SYW02194.1 putative Transcriptional regulator [Oenococcus oeni]SYW03158.1 putative Transcriptional regulator [Oenococcus oeni]SYW04206.1 putative Transcriptional regulator [Oenococcus oeni]SYW18729.1 putative Transcriptional regulator [Oenococcus oeni]